MEIDIYPGGGKSDYCGTGEGLALFVYVALARALDS